MTDQERPHTGEEALRRAASFFREKGWTDRAAQQEARLLLAKAWRKDLLHLSIGLKDQPEETVWETFWALVRQRGNHEPLHYLLGEKEFMSLSLKVSPAVLIPRWDTEVLVEEAIRLMKPLARPRLLDLGTGSGAIAVSLAYYLPAAEVVAVDLSPEALGIARENALRLGVASRIDFREGDLFAPLGAEESFTLIASNPPYLTAEEMRALLPDVRQEPALALAGGEDGLDFYRRIAQEAKNYLAPAGHLLLEIGWQQGAAVTALLAEQGLSPVRILHDLEGRERVVAYSQKD
jgi:release factor glutamine methyltransferase